MTFLKSSEFMNNIESVIHQETQEHKTHFDLTVSEIYQFTEAGSLDFGGSEFKPAKKRLLETQRNEGDKYGWWHLRKGTYQAVMNENITQMDKKIAILSPHPHTQQAGILFNTSLLTNTEANDSIAINFRVPKAGCNIKENARFACVHFTTS